MMTRARILMTLPIAQLGLILPNVYPVVGDASGEIGAGIIGEELGDARSRLPAISISRAFVFAMPFLCLFGCSRTSRAHQVSKSSAFSQPPRGQSRRPVEFGAGNSWTGLRGSPARSFDPDANQLYLAKGTKL
jgi:hypothetical protein